MQLDITVDQFPLARRVELTWQNPEFQTPLHTCPGRKPLQQILKLAP
jgi:hypothetical protein